MKNLRDIVEDAVAKMHRSNSETAVQAAIELLLTDHTTAEVVSILRSWADYLENRR